MLYGPDGSRLRSENAGPPEIDLAEISTEEQLAILWLRSIQPGATQQNVVDFKERVLGMSQSTADIHIRQGIDGLLARGFLAPARDAQGNVIVDARGQPAIDVVGRVVTRLREVRTTH